MRLATIFRERRREPRRKIESAARLLVGDDWQATTLSNLSKGGAALRTDQRPATGSRVLLEIDQLGFFLCRVIRPLDQGIAVQFESATFPERDAPAGTRAPTRAD